MAIDASKNYVAALATSKGEIVVALDAQNAPQTVNNFVFLSCQGFYDGLTFHRYESGFVIQGGGWTTNLEERAKQAAQQSPYRHLLKPKAGALALPEGARVSLAILSGLSVADLENRSPEEQFRLLADRLDRIGDPTRKAATAMAMPLSWEERPITVFGNRSRNVVMTFRLSSSKA